MSEEKDSPTIVVDEDNIDQAKYELLKEKLRYRQATRENAKKIDHKLVRLNIQADALPTKTFFIMNTLSAVIAGYGLLMNSSSVVIGAMLVAMMLGPISGIALSLIDGRWILLRTALGTLLLGVAMIYSIGIVLGLIHFNLPMTHEILSRTQPTLIDLMIALAGGAAGAFASISPRLSVAVVGVAVATALVPPLVASGLLLAHFEFKNAGNALLLAFTNMIAIQCSSSLVLWLAGFRRGSDKEVRNGIREFIKRNFFSLILLLILTVYLSLNFTQMLNQHRYESSATTRINRLLNNNSNMVDSIQFEKQKQATLINVLFIGNQEPSITQLQQLNKNIGLDNRGLPTRLQVRFVAVKMIETN